MAGRTGVWVFTMLLRVRDYLKWAGWMFVGGHASVVKTRSKGEHVVVGILVLDSIYAITVQLLLPL